MVSLRLTPSKKGPAAPPPGSGAGGKGAAAKGGQGQRTGGSRRLGGLRGGSAGKPATAKTPKAPRGARIAQLKQAFQITRRSDPKLPVFLLAAFAVPFVVLLAIGLLVNHPWILGLLGITTGLMAMILVFGRRVQQTAYRQVEGQVGAAAQVLSTMRGDWRVTPAVGFTREQDLVHRVLGRPGIVLVAEGSVARTRNLLANEKKRLARFVGDTPLYDVTVGDADGQLPLRQLERHLAKLPRNIKPKEVNDLDRKLKALPNTALPIPKGPMPTGGRVPRGKTR